MSKAATMLTKFFRHTNYFRFNFNNLVKVRHLLDSFQYPCIKQLKWKEHRIDLGSKW